MFKHFVFINLFKKEEEEEKERENARAARTRMIKNPWPLSLKKFMQISSQWQNEQGWEGGLLIAF